MKNIMDTATWYVALVFVTMDLKCDECDCGEHVHSVSSLANSVSFDL